MVLTARFRSIYNLMQIFPRVTGGLFQTSLFINATRAVRGLNRDARPFNSIYRFTRFTMKFTKALLFSAALIASVGANAQSFNSVAAPAFGDYAAPIFTTPDASLAYTTTGSAPNVNLAPTGATGTYLAVSKGGSATIDLDGATSFSFLWGSPDPTNTITIDGVSFTGTFLLGAAANSSNANSVWATFTDLDGMDSFTITTGQVAFEMAVANPVPEPETYALMLAGLGAVAFVARRRKNA